MLAAVLGGVATSPADAADVYNDRYVGTVYLETANGGIVPFNWDIYFGPNNGGYNGGVAMVAGGVPIYGTHYDLGYYTVVQLNNAPYYSQFLVYKSGPFLVLASFSDNDGNTLAYPGNFLYLAN